MSFVLDASVTASLAFADQSSALSGALEIRLRSEEAFVPRIWWYEIRNLLLTNERRQRITENDSAEFLVLLSSLPISIDLMDEDRSILQVARRYRLSFYDAAYLALAQRKGIPLATLDKALQEAARKAAVPLLGAD